MDLFFLGVGSAINTRMFKSCYLIDGKLLIDTSPEAATILGLNGFALAELSAVLNTHLHADHVLGLPPLITEFLVTELKGERLRVIGPLGLERVVTEILSNVYPEVKPDTFLARAKVTFETLRPQMRFSVEHLNVEVIPAAHGPVQAFGFYIEGPDASLYVTGDTVLTKDVKESVSRADFSLIDVTTTTDRLPSHMNADDLSELAQLLNKGQYIFAVHRTFESMELSTQVLFPRDFERYELRRGWAPEVVDKR